MIFLLWMTMFTATVESSLPPSSSPSLSLCKPTVEETLGCESWCANHPTPWTDPNPTAEQKCAWSKSCGGCDECKYLNQYNEDDISGCKFWCVNHPTPWRDSNPKAGQKCNWSKTCAGCPQCVVDPDDDPHNLLPCVDDDSFNTNIMCHASCTEDPIPWTDPDPSVVQKCKWPKSCGGCPECLLDNSDSNNHDNHHQPTTSISAYPIPAPTTAPTINDCKSWCRNHPAPWRDPDPTVSQKCLWPKNCGGCDECSTTEVSNLPIQPQPPTTACQDWCSNHAVPWTDADPNANQKCKWTLTCADCPQCEKPP